MTSIFFILLVLPKEKRKKQKLKNWNKKERENLTFQTEKLLKIKLHDRVIFRKDSERITAEEEEEEDDELEPGGSSDWGKDEDGDDNENEWDREGEIRGDKDGEG